MKYQRKTVDKRDYRLMFLITLVTTAIATFLLLRELAREQEIISPLPDNPVTHDVQVIEIKEIVPIPVSQKTFDCMENYPEIEDKIKEHFEDEWVEAAELYCRESSFNKVSINPSSGACGLTQALPCSKMGCNLEDVDCQLAWGKDYIERRYGSPAEAVEFHNDHNWY